jgi:hypothetical protein
LGGRMRLEWSSISFQRHKCKYFPPATQAQGAERGQLYEVAKWKVSPAVLPTFVPDPREYRLDGSGDALGGRRKRPKGRRDLI